MEQDTLESRQDEITSLFEEYTNGMSHENFVAVTKDLCNLPSFFSTPLHIRVRLLWLEKKEKEMKESAQKELKTHQKKTAAFQTLTQELLSEDGLVTQEMFVHFWTLEIQPYDRYDRFFRLIKRPDRTFIFPSDFDPFLKELLKYHPGRFPWEVVVVVVGRVVVGRVVVCSCFLVMGSHPLFFFSCCLWCFAVVFSLLCRP